jgi:hypothetical protein
MQYSPEFLRWREAEYRLAEAEASLRCSVESAEANPLQLELAVEVCALREAAAHELSALLLSIELKSNTNSWTRASEGDGATSLHSVRTSLAPCGQRRHV